MTMKLEVNGIQYDNFVTASCEIRLDALSNSFIFEAAMPEGEPLPFKGGSPCRVIINEIPVLTGFIEVIDVSYSSDDHIVTVGGRDKTGDLLDSSLSNISDLRAPITLKSIIQKVLANLNLDIEVIEEVSTKPFSAAQDVVSPEPGDNAFDFIEKYSRKRQVLLTSNGSGNIVITSGSATVAEGSVQHIIDAKDNNVTTSSFSFDTTARFNSYKFISQLNPVSLNFAGDTSLSSVVNQSGVASDPSIRTGRQLVMVAEGSFSNGENKSRAKWEANIRKSRSLQYSATVSGYRVDTTNKNSELWRINRLYQIVDDYLGKSQRMLCNSVIFTLDTQDGELTLLSFVDETAYSLELSKPQAKKTSKTALSVLFQ